MTDEKNGKPFEPGDRVQVRNKYLVGKGALEMGPTIYVRGGWPNEFEVYAVVDHKGRWHVSLDQCCRKRTNPATGQFTCFGHLADYFEEHEGPSYKEAPERIPDRVMLASTPFGDIGKIEYYDDDKTPGIELRLGNGKPFVMAGGLVKGLGKWLQEKGWL